MSQTTMQQVIITEPGGVDKLAYETVTIPEAKADEVLVRFMRLVLTVQIFYSVRVYIQCRLG